MQTQGLQPRRVASPCSLPHPHTPATKGNTSLRIVPMKPEAKESVASQSRNLDSRSVQPSSRSPPAKRSTSPTPATAVAARTGRKPMQHQYMDTSKVPKNAKGGPLVTEEEIEASFQFLDHHGSGRITMANLKKRLSIFYKDMPAAQLKHMMGGKSELTLKDLKELLLDNTLTHFDPIVDAFKVYDPEGVGYIQPEVLLGIFQDLELAKLTKEDISILIEAADADKDGKIGLEDFKRLSGLGREENKHRDRDELLSIETMSVGSSGDLGTKRVKLPSVKR